MDVSSYVTLAEAGDILTERGFPLDPAWLRRKVAAGTVGGAIKIGSTKKGTWLIPRQWAESYVKNPRGRKRRDLIGESDDGKFSTQ